MERLVKEALSLGRTTLTEPETYEILNACSIAVPRHRVVKDVRSALIAAEVVGYPLVLKVVSREIAHKSEAGGVATGVRDGSALEMAWSRLVIAVSEKRPEAAIEGVIVEEMVSTGVEVIAGAMMDEQFGPIAVFGTGGVAVELMKDVSIRLAPLSRSEADEMIREVRGFPLLGGFRGDSPKDIAAIADVLMKLAAAVEEIGGLKEIEVNPLVVHERGAVAADARAVLG
jgi:acetyl-CoA synthetase (ADP-forming)